MPRYLTVAEFEALVRERVKPPRKVKHPPSTAEQQRAAIREKTAKHQRAAKGLEVLS